jgi:uncharacterized protein (DUF885 family)
VSRIFEIAHSYVDDLAALDPITATGLGIPGHERRLTDYSPDGYASVADLNRRTVAALEAADPVGDRDRIARDFMLERLRLRVELYEAQEPYRDLRIIASPMSGIRSVFDQMPKETPDDWADIAARLTQVPGALANYRRTLSEGAAKGLTVSRRQVSECVRQAEIWSGQREGEKSFFDILLDNYDRLNIGASAVRDDLVPALKSAKRGYAEMDAYLRDEYMPHATEREAAGSERYGLLAQVFLGATIDPREAYEWGWAELHRLEEDMRKTADRIVPGGTVDDAKALLETDPARIVEGVEAYREWLQVLHDEALDALDGVHFVIDPRIRRIEVMIPPPGGALAAYYTGPSEDFKRPGRTWWPTGTRTAFPKWTEVTTAYHEGVPGHHLQVASARVLGDKVSRFQSMLGFISGYGEGWALYSERLMGELGFLENPDYYLGMLSAQALRAVRVIIDIGLHLEFKIPDSEDFHPGEVWNHDLALQFAIERSGWNPEMLASEIVRYLGWPAQAISYKLGERKWLEVREARREREGANFDLKRFHADALDLGPLGLDQLEREMAL